MISARSASCWALPIAGSFRAAMSNVVGFDNIPEGAMHRPSLTTVAIGARAIGEESARLPLRCIDAPDGPPESIILPPRLIVRSSCGAIAPQ